MKQPITLKEILDVKYLGEWAWSPVGKSIAYLWDDGGQVDLWLVGANGSPAQNKLTSAKDKVATFCFAPDSSLYFIMDGNLWHTSPQNPALHQLTALGDATGGLKVDPSGRLVAFIASGAVCILNSESGLIQKAKTPGRVMTLHGWSQDSNLLLFRYTDDAKVPYIGVLDSTGSFLWGSRGELGLVGDAQWVTTSTFIYQETRELGTVNDWYVVTLPATREDFSPVGVPFKLTPCITPVLHEEQYERKGVLVFSGVLPHADGDRLLFSLEQDGWLHHYLYSLTTGKLTQLTHGECEDFGHAGDKPAWSPDGKCLAYASNKGDRIRRALWLLDIATGQARQAVSFGYTNVQPKWSPDGTKLAFVHCDHAKNADIWVVDLSNLDHPTQLTFSMPEALEHKLLKPEHVTYKGALDWDIDAFVMKPADFNPNKKYPAIVWVHGGPIRQLRGSWHPMHSYALFYAYNHYLTSRGYVVLEVNYRGGIGYGTKFRFGLHHKMGVDDVVDIVNAGRYLKSLPYVQEDKVAVYGLSYGGYMTLHSLTQYPDEFAMGVNIAGIWDYAQWSRWIEKNSGRRHNLFSINFGGSPDECPALYAQGSPVTFKQGLKNPLINFHGTKDLNVDFEQMDRIVADCVKMGKTYEAYYYPGEVHTFAYRHTWLDAFVKMDREFDKYLK